MTTNENHTNAKSDWMSKTLWAVAWPIVFFSAWTSANGLRAFFANSPGGDAWYLFPFFLGVAGAFHVISVISFMQFRDRGRWRGLGFYIVLTAAAILLSIGWHWSHVNGVSYARGQYEGNRAGIVQTLINANEGFSQVVGALVSLQSYSDSTAKTEIGTGGTCGGVPHKSDGVRYRFRMADKEISSTLAATAKQRAELLAKLQAKAQALPATAVNTVEATPRIIAIADELTGLTAGDRLVADIRRQVEDRLTLARSGIGTEKGKVVLCPDLRRETLLKNVLEATKLPTFTFKGVIDPANSEETQKAALSRIFKGAMQIEDWIAVSAASLVEFTVFIVLILIPRRRSIVGDELDALDDLIGLCDWTNVNALRRLAEQHADADMAFVRLVEEYVFWDRVLWFRTPILAVPANPAIEVHRQLHIIAVGLTRCGWATRPWTPDWFYRARLRLRWSDTQLRRLARENELTFYKLDGKSWDSIVLTMAMTPRTGPDSPEANAGSPSPKPMKYLPVPYLRPAGAA